MRTSVFKTKRAGRRWAKREKNFKVRYNYDYERNLMF